MEERNLSVVIYVIKDFQNLSKCISNDLEDAKDQIFNKVKDMIVEGDTQSIQFLDDQEKNPLLLGINIIKCDKIKMFHCTDRKILKNIMQM